MPQREFLVGRQIEELLGGLEDVVLDAPRYAVSHQGEEAARLACASDVPDDLGGGIGRGVLEIGGNIYGWNLEGCHVQAHRHHAGRG